MRRGSAPNRFRPMENELRVTPRVFNIEHPDMPKWNMVGGRLIWGAEFEAA